MLIFIKPSKTSLIATIISEIDPAHDEGVFQRTVQRLKRKRAPFHAQATQNIGSEWEQYVLSDQSALHAVYESAETMTDQHIMCQRKLMNKSQGQQIEIGSKTNQNQSFVACLESKLATFTFKNVISARSTRTFLTYISEIFYKDLETCRLTLKAH